MEFIGAKWKYVGVIGIIMGQRGVMMTHYGSLRSSGGQRSSVELSGSKWGFLGGEWD